MPRPLRYDPDNDFYTVLGVPPTATLDEVHRAYRQRAKLVHPDLNRDRREWAHDQFQRLNNAHDILGDLALRAEYNLKRQLYLETRKPGYKSPAMAEASRAAWARRNRRKPPPLYYVSVGILTFGTIPIIFWIIASIILGDQTSSPTTVPSIPAVVVPLVNAQSTCSDPHAIITDPHVGAQAHGPLVIRGTASGEQFSSYRVEIANSYLLHRNLSRFSWIPLERASTTPVNNDILVPVGVVDQFPILHGDLTLRLTVTNADGTTLDPCEVSFHLTGDSGIAQDMSASGS